MMVKDENRSVMEDRRLAVVLALAAIIISIAAIIIVVID